MWVPLPTQMPPRLAAVCEKDRGGQELEEENEEKSWRCTGLEEENVGQRDKGKTLITGSQSSLPKVKPCGKGSGTSAGTMTHPKSSRPPAGTEDGTAALPAHLGHPATFCRSNLCCLHGKHALSRYLGHFMCCPHCW